MTSPRAALALTGRLTAPEHALIEALPARYPQRDPIDDQRPWNDAFAAAMRLAHQAHPDDLDLRFIFAEAILNRTPWHMLDLRTGEPAPGAGTLEAREVLESAFRDLPGVMNHPGLLHTIDELQADLDVWIAEYNGVRPHQGRWCFGKTPMQTFLDQAGPCGGVGQGVLCRGDKGVGSLVS